MASYSNLHTGVRGGGEGGVEGRGEKASSELRIFVCVLGIRHIIFLILLVLFDSPRVHLRTKIAVQAEHQ